MITINSISYSTKNIREVSLKKINDVNLDRWEIDFWEFLDSWFNNKNETITLTTSGSTGKPKSIKLLKKYMLASAKMTCRYFDLNKSKTALLCLPINSVGGLMMVVRAIFSGMNLLIQKPSSNPLKSLSNKIDFVAMVPFQVQKTLKENSRKWSFVNTVIIGGGKVSNLLENEIVRYKINAFSTFGMTETISHIALNKIGENRIYTALETCFFSIKDNGCLIISAKHLGIENLETNDIVNLIDKQHFIWLGRKDHAIETGGVKIIPELVEQKIAHLFEERFFISSIPDKNLNNKVILFLESTIQTININDLKLLLTKYECPKEIIYIKQFSETKTAKLSRKLTVENFLNTK